MANMAFKYRIVPDQKQEHQMSCTFGCARFVYNHCLDEQERAYAAGEGYISAYTMKNSFMVGRMKQDFLFLKDVDKFALENAVFHLDDAYQRMFQGLTRHPKHKSKHKSKRSYTTNFTNGNIEVGLDYVKLPKLGKVKAIVHRKVPEGYRLKSATVSQEADGSCYCSVLYEYDECVAKIEHPELNALGLDYKSDGLYEDSNGHVCGSPKYYRKAQDKLARAQKKLSRKQGPKDGTAPSNNYLKQKKHVAKQHRHVANQRKDFNHKESTAIAKQYDLVCVEDLNMRSMANKGFGNGKATMDNGYGMFLSFLDYKLRNKGGALVKVDKWFPSSQLCHCCGYQNRDMKDLDVRSWACPECGAEHDRDENAAINIKIEGVRMFFACDAT